MKGRPGGHGAKALLVLTVSHVVAATLTPLVAAGVGAVSVGHLPSSTRVGLLVVVAVGCAVLDVRAIVQRNFACGMRRQTPRSLMQNQRLPWWVVPVVWGFDTGTLVTTYRMTHAIWVVIFASFLGVAPVWIGALVGTCFIVPLIGSSVFGFDGHLGRPEAKVADRAKVAFQLGSFATLLATAAVGVGILA